MKEFCILYNKTAPDMWPVAISRMIRVYSANGRKSHVPLLVKRRL